MWITDKIAQAQHWVQDHKQVPEKVVAEGVAYVRDHLDLAFHGPAKGPFPTLKALQQKFPKAGLPDRLIGTTIDIEAMNAKGETADSLMARVAAMGMNSVRLGAYWDDSQPKAGVAPDFKRLDDLLAAARKYNIKVVLTVGAKAPNWPEFHVPTWAKPKDAAHPDQDAAFRANTEAWVAAVAKRYAAEPAIAMWQVENEPFDPSGPAAGLFGQAQVKREAAILRKADAGRRPVMVNVWSSGTSGDALKSAFAVGDLVGLDVYKSVGIPQGAFERTVALPQQALKLAKATGKPAMIAELQADDWGGYRANSNDVGDLTHALERMGFRDLLFWRLSQNIKNEKQGDPGLTRTERSLAVEALSR
ncbi:MAG: hypothetical protein JWM80_5489 [Cyanobacteria bacterium RYN_339]|nr:hypothetical protein [Cyanobacteria bacterium RYN_339]